MDSISFLDSTLLIVNLGFIWYLLYRVSIQKQKLPDIRVPITFLKQFLFRNSTTHREWELADSEQIAVFPLDQRIVMLTNRVIKSADIILIGSPQEYDRVRIVKILEKKFITASSFKDGVIVWYNISVQAMGRGTNKPTKISIEIGA